MTNCRLDTNELSVAEMFGNIDVYLFDQLQKARFTPDMCVLDAGCGAGRNIVFMLRSGFEVFGMDRDESSIQRVRAMARDLAPDLPSDHFQVGDISSLAFPDKFFDVVICNAVLHFAESELEFGTMCEQLVRVLRPGGFLFARLASDIGIEDSVVCIDGRRFHLPDGSDRFLVNEKYLLEMTVGLGCELFEPIRTVNVQGVRCMTTWCLRKQDA